jgi:hypothetical protein
MMDVWKDTEGESAITGAMLHGPLGLKTVQPAR